MLDVVERRKEEAVMKFYSPGGVFKRAMAFGRRRARAKARSRRNVPKRHRHGRTQRTRGRR